MPRARDSLATWERAADEASIELSESAFPAMVLRIELHTIRRVTMNRHDRHGNPGRRLRAGVLTAALAAGMGIGAPAVSARVMDSVGTQGIGRQSNDLTASEATRIRLATHRFRDVDEALDAGYEPMGGCMDMPGDGAVGQVYMNHALMEDGQVDPTKPEMLLYEMRHHGDLRLTGVGYHAVDDDQDTATDDDRPSLMGHPFDGPMMGHEPGMPIHYFLHAWVFKHNPSGDLAAENPRVSCDAAG